MLLVNNHTNTNLLLSANGTQDHLEIAAGAGMVLDLCTNRSDMDGMFEIAAGGYIYVRYDAGAPFYQAAPGLNSYISVIAIYAASK
jgi:hypothetical protein